MMDFNKEISLLKSKVIEEITEKYRQGYVVDFETITRDFDNIAFVNGECQSTFEFIPFICSDGDKMYFSFWEMDSIQESDVCWTPVVPDGIDLKFFQHICVNEECQTDPLEEVCIEHLVMLRDYMILP